MMAKNANLDALIPREDFEVKDQNTLSTNKSQTLTLRDLESNSFFLGALRKPDFQRETNEWDQERIISLLDSFLNSDLIPAVILWKSSSGYTFVIDGAHRLSALAAWVNDDYGDGGISKSFYESVIPEEQIKVAQRLREKINKLIGPYSDYKLAISSPQKVKPEILNKALHLGSLAISIQWVDGDAKKAEASFFKINQKAAPIDKTELQLLEARNKANGIATRAILRGGKGHKYWSSFSEDYQKEVQELAESIHNLLFTPPIKTPLKTLDIPLGGQNFSSHTQLLVLEFVNVVNNISSNTQEVTQTNDELAAETIKYLKSCEKIAKQINSNHSSSLGLHPAVYFYTNTGRYKPASFIVFLQFLMKLNSQNKLKQFINVRSLFEEIVLHYDDLPRQIIRKYRTSNAGAPHVVEFYMQVLKSLEKSKNVQESIADVLSQSAFSYLTMKIEENKYQTKAAEFNSERKTAVFLSEAIRNAMKCKICGGFLHTNSISIDHIERKEDGGLGTIDNGQLTHPYCNTAIKN